MIVIILLSILVLMLFISWTQMIKEAKKINVHGPLPLPIIGNGHLFAGTGSDFLKALSRLAREYDDVVLVHLFSRRHVVVSEPKYIEAILSSSEIIAKGNSYVFLLPWLGQGLLTSAGDRWRTHRKLLTPAFHFDILRSFLAVFNKNERILENKLHKLADGRPIDLFPIIALAALDNITESVMGVCVNAQNDDESSYVKAIKHVTEIVALRIRNPFITDMVFSMLPYKRRYYNNIKTLQECVNNVINIRRKELTKTSILQDSSEFGVKNKNAFLDLLLLAEINGCKIDDESIREEVDTFMFEGHDTTASGIVYTLYCISKRNGVQKQILNELTTIFGGNMDREPTYKELQQMKYLEQVIKESMRLYPPVPLIERLVTQDIDIGGLHLTRNTSIIVNIFEMQRNPKVFEDPMSFRPERFATGGPTSPYSWVAFSAGPRNCIGQKFAMMEMKVVISSIVKKFKLLPVDIEPELHAELILRSPEGVFVKFLPRS